MIMLYLNNIALAHSIANTFINKANNYNTPIEDIYQEANIALWLACRDYNGSVKFSTFAYRVINNKLLNYFDRIDEVYKNREEEVDIVMDNPEKLIQNKILLNSLINKAKLNKSRQKIIKDYIRGLSFSDMGRKHKKSYQYFHNEFIHSINILKSVCG